MNFSLDTALRCLACGFVLESYVGLVADTDPRVVARYKEHAEVCEGQNVTGWPADIEKRAQAYRETT